MFEKYAGEDVEAWIVLWEGRNGAATQADCRALQQRYGLSRVKVFYQPTGRELADADMDDRHYHYVLTEGAVLFHRRQFNDGTFEAALDQALAR